MKKCLALTLFVISCSTATPQSKPATTFLDKISAHVTTPQPASSAREAADQPAQQELAPPKIPLMDPFALTSLIYTVCIDSEQDGPLVQSDCPTHVGNCWLKLPAEKQMSPVGIVECAMNYFDEKKQP